jgi:hypothetical protein
LRAVRILPKGAPTLNIKYIGIDVHKRSYCSRGDERRGETGNGVDHGEIHQRSFPRQDHRACLASDLQIQSLVRERLELQQKELRVREKRNKSRSSLGIQCYSSADSNILLQDNRVENLPCLVVHVDSRLGIIRVSRRGVLRDQKQLVNGIELDVLTGLNLAPI